DGNAIQRLAVDRLQDRLAGRTARFSVVVEAVGLADAERPAIMAGCGIGMAGDEFLGRRFVGHGGADRQKAALLDFLLETLDALKRKHPPAPFVRGDSASANG